MSVNRLPLAKRTHSAVWFGHPRKGPMPSQHSKQKVALIQAIGATHKSSESQVEAMRGLTRLMPLNRAAVRRVANFAKHRNWPIEKLVADLCSVKSEACR